uniref:Cam kinase kinase protein 1, isoform a, putative n=1 Tax=Brugia malayi TaxID=6279 RepID=A8P8U8_BRUMA
MTLSIFRKRKSIISKSLKLLILNLLKKDPGLRLMLNEIKEHNWVTQNGRYPMPSETTNCELITVTNEEIQNCVRNIPHLDTLILIKFMVHRRRFGNPFKSMDVLNAKTKNLLLNAGTIKANRSESVDKKVNRSSGSWL